MKIEYNGKKFEIADAMHILGYSLLSWFAVVLFLCGMFTLSYHLYRYDSDCANFMNGILHLFSFRAVFWFIFVIALIYLASKFLIFDVKTKCLICGKPLYTNEGHILNPEEFKKEGSFARVICEEHKKPYMIPVLNTWKEESKRERRIKKERLAMKIKRILTTTMVFLFLLIFSIGCANKPKEDIYKVIYDCYGNSLRMGIENKSSEWYAKMTSQGLYSLEDEVLAYYMEETDYSKEHGLPTRVWFEDANSIGLNQSCKELIRWKVN